MLQSAASSQLWTVQRRSLQCLPEHAANKLLALLLQKGTLGAVHLNLFHECVTRATIRATPGWQPGGEWVQHLGRFRSAARPPLVQALRPRRACTAPL
jgi:hypothetical protein